VFRSLLMALAALAAAAVVTSAADPSLEVTLEPRRFGIEDAAIYNEQVDVFQALQAGQIDATLAALPTALFVTAVQVPDARIVALLPADENDTGHGLLFEFGNPLVPWVDEALGAIIERGVVDDLIATYLVADPDLPIITE